MAAVNETETTKQGSLKLTTRLLIYVGGLFILTFGTTLSINTRLGLSAGNSFPYVLNLISGVSFGTALIIVYLAYVVIQWLLLGKQFGKKNLLQIPVALLYGRFANFWVFIIGDFTPETYPGRLVLLLISIVFVGMGIAVYVSPRVVSNPIEGLSFAAAKRLNWPFHRGKTLIDCLSAAAAIGLCAGFLGHFTGIGEGTVLSALLTGKTAHAFSLIIDPLVNPQMRMKRRFFPEKNKGHF